MTWNYRFKTKPDDCQLLALKQALKRRKYGIFFEQRVGKSKVAVDFCGALHVKDDVRKVLILSPLSVRTTWEEQLETHMSQDVRYNFILYPKSADARKKLIKDVSKPDTLTFIVVNYDVIKSEYETLKKWKPEVIILDEAHKLCGYSSQRSKYAHYLTRECENVLGLTGTPIRNKPENVFGLFRAIDPNVFGTKWSAFKDKYCIMGGYMGYDVVGYKDKEEIAEIIADHSIRVLRRDVMDEPDVETYSITVDLEPEARRIYTELKNNSITELTGSSSSVIADMAGVRVMRLQQIAGGFIKDEDEVIHRISTAKLSATVALIRDKLENDEPVVVFARFLAEIDALQNMLAEHSIASMTFTGSIPEAERTRIRKLFQDGGINVIIMQIGTGVMGISLDRSHNNVFYSLDYNLDNFKQAKDRVMGRGQTSSVVNNYFIIAKNTVDRKIMTTLRNNGNLAREIIDDWRGFLKDEE